MNWISSNAKSVARLPDLTHTVGKAGTTDSVAVIAVIGWLIRRLL